MARPTNLIRLNMVNLLLEKRVNGTQLLIIRATYRYSGEWAEFGAGAASGDTSPGKGSSTTSSVNAFSGRNRYQAAPHTSRNTASSTAKSVRRMMGLPPTRLGAFCRPPLTSVWMPCRKEGYSRLANHREPMARLRAAGRNGRRAVGGVYRGKVTSPEN